MLQSAVEETAAEEADASETAIDKDDTIVAEAFGAGAAETSLGADADTEGVVGAVDAATDTAGTEETVTTGGSSD